MSWQDRAECRNADPEEFEQGGPDAAEACRRCPVRGECFGEAMTPLSRHVYPDGYRAGTTDDRRVRLRWGGWRAGDPLPQVQSAVEEAGTGFAAETFAYAVVHGTRAAAARWQVHSMCLYRAWDRHQLGRPGRSWWRSPQVAS